VCCSATRAPNPTAGLPLEPVTPDVAAGAVDHAIDVMWGWPSDGAGYEPQAVVEFIISGEVASVAALSEVVNHGMR
jgi:hypothetical protein